jgi:quercetin dioxygenase-like cupin family protein
MMTTSPNDFHAWDLHGGVAIDVPASPAGPIHLHTWSGSVTLPAGGSAVVLPAAATDVIWPGMRALITEGCYAVAPGGARLEGGLGLIIHTPAYRGLLQIGGPLEGAGRLRYIDGCSDTLLVCAALVGEPCLNHLHLPPGIAQTEHTHPSERIGIILRGRGVCRTPGREVELRPGMFWHIPTGCRHSFHTQAESLDVIAWHPDSDFGPSHDAHPMVNRTIVDGVPANDPRHAGIRTQA